MDQYLIRFVQAHESFRQPEIEALGTLSNIHVDTVRYSKESPFCVILFEDSHVDFEKTAKNFVSRSILSRGIYELWGQGSDYDNLHMDIKRRTSHLWDNYEHVSFKFSVDVFRNTRSAAEQRDIINSFRYLGFEGRIIMKCPEVEFFVFEEWNSNNAAVLNGTGALDENEVYHHSTKTLNRVFLGRKVAESCRSLIDKHDLKKRPYISTTSMDAELALVTANLALASREKFFLDPFVGTGGFMIAAAEFGATVLGSDIDGRSFRGKGTGIQKGIGANIGKYGLNNCIVDCVTADITNSPFRFLDQMITNSTKIGWLDGIICDPPYGVREGLKVLGLRNQDLGHLNGSSSDSETSDSSTPRSPFMIDGIPAYTLPGYIAPKKPYSFNRMLNHILDFASRTLVDHGRLAFWMPSANENEYGEEEVTTVPCHDLLELKHECIQRFNRWSRRLLVYEKTSSRLYQNHRLARMAEASDLLETTGKSADDLNPFRKRYFQAFGDRSKG